MFSQKEKKDLQNIYQSNKHEVYVVSFEEMDAIIKSSPKGDNQNVQVAWKKIKGKINTGVSYYASADDVVTMTKLVGDLGGIGARAYIKNYSGKPHIILKGHPGLRTILTGTKYGITNPKVVSIGLGKTGAIAAAKQGGILTVILLSTYRVVDYFLTDQATLTQLVGTLATDIVKVGIATAASIGASVIAGGLTLAIGPILAVVVVGVGMSMLLEYADNSLGITKRVIAGLEELESNAKNHIAQQKRNAVNSTTKSANKIIDYTIKSARRIAINWVRSALREYISPSRKVW
jgi:hypothetical protein